MRLFVTKPSPYARKAWSAVLALGLEDRVDIVELPARMPTVPKPELEAINPLGKVPTLSLDSGGFVADSPVIVAYLDELAGGGLIPVGAERWQALTLEALADGCMDAGVVIRVESLKPADRRDPTEAAAHAPPRSTARSTSSRPIRSGWERSSTSAASLWPARSNG